MKTGVLTQIVSTSVIAVVALWAPATEGKGPDAAAQPSQRQKMIDFEDELVEGLNKRPLDSLSQISEKEKRKRRPHLYRKRASFRTETAETLRELRFVP